MNAQITSTRKRTLSPLAISSDSMQALALWLVTHGPRQTRRPDPRRTMVERYPAGLLSEAELDALVDVLDR